MGFAKQTHGHHKGSGTLSLSTGITKKKKPSNMGFYKPKAKKNGNVVLAFTKKKTNSKPLPPWTKKAQRMDYKKTKSGISKDSPKASKGAKKAATQGAKSEAK